MATVVSAVLAGALVVACSPAAAPGQEPTAGGVSPAPKTPPASRMGAVERRVAHELARRVRLAGLTLEHVDCPQWRGHVPAELACTGWFDGVEGTVAVRLSRGRHRAVAFDAALTGGVVATRLVVERLLAEGYVDVDCGGVPAYPATVGDSLVCLVTRHGDHGHVVATVTDPDGSVRVSAP